MKLKDLLQLMVDDEPIRLYIGRTDMSGVDILVGRAKEILSPSVLNWQVLELGAVTDDERCATVTIVVESIN